MFGWLGTLPLGIFKCQLLKHTINMLLVTIKNTCYEGYYTSFIFNSFFDIQYVNSIKDTK